MLAWPDAKTKLSLPRLRATLATSDGEVPATTVLLSPIVAAMPRLPVADAVALVPAAKARFKAPVASACEPSPIATATLRRPLASAVASVPSATDALVRVLVQPVPAPRPVIDAQVALAVPAPLIAAAAKPDASAPSTTPPATVFEVALCLPMVCLPFPGMLMDTQTIDPIDARVGQNSKISTKKIFEPHVEVFPSQRCWLELDAHRLAKRRQPSGSAMAKATCGGGHHPVDGAAILCWRSATTRGGWFRTVPNRLRRTVCARRGDGAVDMTLSGRHFVSTSKLH